jgi:hypothetical protein
VFASVVRGIDDVAFEVGEASTYYGDATAGTGSMTSLSGTANVTVSGTLNTAAKAIYSSVNATAVYGIEDTDIELGTARTSVYVGGTATGAAGTIGAITGSAITKVTAAGVVVDSYVDAYGIQNLDVEAGEASGRVAVAGTGSIAAGSKISGTAYGKADAPTATGLVDADVVGLDYSYFSAGNAYGYIFTKGGKATAANGTIGDIYGKADAITIAESAVSGTAVSYAVGIRSSSADAAFASAYDSFAATGVIGAITGLATATATGFNTGATSKGIDPSSFTAGQAYSRYYNTATAGTGTIGNVTGTAVSTATSTNGSAKTSADGIYSLFLAAGSAFGAGTIGGTGYIGNITGTATATGNSSKGGDSASADGIYNLDVYAGFTQDGSDFGSTSSKVGNVTGSGTANDGDDNAYAYGIRISLIYSAGSIGNLDGDAVGAADDGDGIRTTSANARTSVGNIEGTSNVDDGIYETYVSALTTIGNITGTSSRTSGGYGDGIFRSQFVAGSGIGNIVGTTADTGSGSYGIYSSAFRAGTGSIGTITASTAEAGGEAITSSTFSAVGNIGAISVTGGVQSSRFLAGIDIGTDVSLSAGEANAAVAATIGAVTVSGAFDFSDLIAAVNAGAGSTTWGNADDTAVAGGSIGAVSIGVGALTGANNGLSHGILADTIASITVNGNPVADPENNSMDTDVRIFQF